LKVGILPTGPLDAITDVSGVEVGQTTIIRGGDVRTGVTAILPHPGNLFREKVPGAIFVGNAFGKLAGSTQVNELVDCRSEFVSAQTAAGVRVFPLDRASVGRVGVDVTTELASQVRDRGENAAGDDLAYDLGEPDLDWLSHAE
jgi:L-aminopeptidase/D-esterase-like protein